MLDPAAVDGASAQDDGAPAGPAHKTLSLGKGGTNITMLLPLSAAGTAGESGRKMRDAAQLAMADLGNDLITLTIEDTRGDSPLAKSMAVNAMGSGAKVVIGPTELPAARQLSKVSGTKRPPILALADNFSGSPGVYSVRLSETDSAAAGAAAIAAKGSRKFVLLVAEGADSVAVGKRVTNSLSIHGATLVVTLPYSTIGGGSEKAVADLAALVDAPEAIIVASGSSNPSAIVSSLRTKGLVKKGVSLIGTNRWLEHSLNDPMLEGAYIAALDQTETGPIAAASRAPSTMSLTSTLPTHMTWLP